MMGFILNMTDFIQQFMDAVMWMHNSRNANLKDAIVKIGTTRRVGKHQLIYRCSAPDPSG